MIALTTKVPILSTSIKGHYQESGKTEGDGLVGKSACHKNLCEPAPKGLERWLNG